MSHELISYEGAQMAVGVALLVGIVMGFTLGLFAQKHLKPRHRTPPEEGGWAKDDLRRAFVIGAKWWEFTSTSGTMWASDVDKAEAEAERRYPEGKVKE